MQLYYSSFEKICLIKLDLKLRVYSVFFNQYLYFIFVLFLNFYLKKKGEGGLIEADLMYGLFQMATVVEYIYHFAS